MAQTKAESCWESSDDAVVTLLPLCLCCHREGKNNTEREVKMQSHFRITPTKTGLNFLKHLLFKSTSNSRAAVLEAEGPEMACSCHQLLCARPNPVTLM